MTGTLRRLGKAVLPPAVAFGTLDADKEWHKNYLDAVLPKLQAGGCYVTHNVSSGRRRGWGRDDYVKYLLAQPGLETTFDTRGGGMAISYKK